MMIEFVQALVDMDDSVDLVDKYQIIWKQDRVINWPVVSPYYVPNQVEMDDGDNCGVYVIHFIQVPSEIPFITPRTVVTANHRFVVMASLILWRENSLRAKVMQLAFAHLKCKIPT